MIRSHSIAKHHPSKAPQGTWIQREPFLALITLLAATAIVGALVEPWVREQLPQLHATVKALTTSALTQK